MKPCTKCESKADQIEVDRKDVNGRASEVTTWYCDACDYEFTTVERCTVFVNAYLVGRACGGPEEGGWWFDYGQPLESVRCSTWAGAQAMRKCMEASEEYSNEGLRDRNSVIGDEQHEIYIENKFAEAFPATTPRYC